MNSEKNKTSHYEKFREFVIKTASECKSENYEHSKRYSPIRGLNHEKWKLEFPEYESEDERKYLELDLIYEKKDKVLVRFYGNHDIIGNGIRTYLEMNEKHGNLGKAVISHINYLIENEKEEELNEKFKKVNQLLRYNAPQLKEERFPAPEWLVFPEIPCGSIGWRMGYGEDYLEMQMVADFSYNQYESLFKEPENWTFKYFRQFEKYVEERLQDKENFRFPPYSIPWSPNGKPKYEYVNENTIILDDELKDKLLNNPLRIDIEHYENLKEAYMDSKSKTQNKELWKMVRYSVLLNIMLFKVLEDENLIADLLKTEHKLLIVESTDPFWQEKEKYLSLALSEVRDEVSRIYMNNDKIDWFYTEFLKQAPYDLAMKKKRNYINKNTAEYMVFLHTYQDAKLYVRDTNLSEKQAKMYVPERIIQERTFVDATPKIGKMTTTHRFSILSNHIANLSEFENEKDWNIHTTPANSIFKVLDVYEHNEKTQILLLHLINGFESIFRDARTTKRECVEKSREIFEESFEKEVIASVNSTEWLERCEFPVGLNDEDEYWEIQ